MKIKIFDKKEFIQNFLSPISTLNSVCCIDVQNNELKTICSSPDNTLCLISSQPASSDEVKLLNLPDVKRLSGALSLIKTKDIELNVIDNNIKYNDGNFKFSYHLLENGLIKKTTINVDKVNKLEYNICFDIPEQNLDTLLKGTSFAAATNKIYLYTESDKIYAELGDKTKHNVDNFITVIAEKYTGNNITKPLPINLDTFRLIYFNGASSIKCSINTSYGVIKIDIIKGNTNLTYIMSALIN